MKNTMNGLKNMSKPMKILLAVAAGLLVIAMVVDFATPNHVVDVFSYAQIKDDVGRATPVKDAYTDEVIDRFPIDMLEDVEESVREPHDPAVSKGVILVMEPIISRNVLIAHDYTNDTDEELSPYRFYPDLREGHLSGGYAHVETTVVIKEIIYQEEGLNLKVGDKVKLWERYYILDDRVPQLRTDDGTKRYQIMGEHPMEAGRTYYFCGVYWLIDDSRLKNHLYSGDGIYDLGDPMRQVGPARAQWLLEDGADYLKAHYNFSKYGLK